MNHLLFCGGPVWLVRCRLLVHARQLWSLLIDLQGTKNQLERQLQCSSEGQSQFPIGHSRCSQGHGSSPQRRKKVSLRTSAVPLQSSYLQIFQPAGIVRVHLTAQVKHAFALRNRSTRMQACCQCDHSWVMDLTFSGQVHTQCVLWT